MKVRRSVRSGAEPAVAPPVAPTIRLLYIPYMRLLVCGVGETLGWGFVSNEWGAAMRMDAGLDIGGKRTAICVIDGSGKAVWRGTVDTHPEMIDGALQRFKGSLDKVGLESGPFTPHLFRSLEAIGYPMICMGAPRGRRDQKPTDQERQGRRLGAGRDIADRLVFLGLRQVGRHASVKGAVGRA